MLEEPWMVLNGPWIGAKKAFGCAVSNNLTGEEDIKDRKDGEWI